MRQIFDDVDSTKMSNMMHGKTKRWQKVPESYNGGHLFNQPHLLGAQSVIMQPTMTLMDGLDLSGIGVPKGRTMIPVLAVEIKSQTRVHHAYVLQRGYSASAAGKSILNTLLAVYQAADAIDVGLATLADILAFFTTRQKEDALTVELVCHVRDSTILVPLSNTNS